MHKFLAAVCLLGTTSNRAVGFLQLSTLPRVSHSSCLAASRQASDESAVDRRDFLSTTCVAVATALVLSPPAYASTTSDTSQYIDPKFGFKISVPDGWTQSEAEVSGRRKIVVWTSPETSNTNAFLASTPIKGDFTSLGSFGTADEVSRTLIPDGEGISGKMLAMGSGGGKYLYDYTIAPGGGRAEKHLKSLWYVVPGDTLVTLTVQCDENDYSKFEKDMDAVMASFTK